MAWAIRSLTLVYISRPLARWHPMIGSSSSHKIRNVRFDRRKHCRNSSSVNYSNASFASLTSLRRLCSTADAAQARQNTVTEKENAMFSKCLDTEKARSAYISIQSMPPRSHFNSFVSLHTLSLTVRSPLSKKPTKTDKRDLGSRDIERHGIRHGSNGPIVYDSMERTSPTELRMHTRLHHWWCSKGLLN